MNNDNFLIEERDLELARDICKYIENPVIRNRAVANAIAGNVAEKYFTEIEIDTASGLHNISYVLNNLEISDIYINNCYIDVRLYFNDNELCVPKILFDKGIEPSAFMFIKVTPDLAGGTVTGFALPNEIDTSVELNGYYKVNEDQLVSFYDIEPLLTDRQAQEFIDDIDQKVFSFLDGSLENVDEFYKELLSSKDARERLAIAAKAQNIFNFISITKPEENHVSASPETTKKTLEEDSPVNMDMSSEPLILEEEPVEFSLEETSDFEPIEDFENSLVQGEPFDLSAETGSFELEETDAVNELENFGNESPEELIENTTDKDIEDIEIPVDNDIEKEFDEQEETSPFNEITSDGNLSSDIDGIEYSEISAVNYEGMQIADTYEQVTEAADTDIVEEIIPNSEEDTDTLLENEIPEYNPDTNRISDENSIPEASAETFEYSTSTTPSINTIEESMESKEGNEGDVNNEESLEDLLEKSETKDEEVSDDVQNENTPQIDTLFNQTSEEEEIDSAVNTTISKKKSSKLLPIVGVLAVLGAVGYYGYTKFMMPASSTLPAPQNDLKQTQVKQAANKKKAQPVQEAMPIETVENIETPAKTEEAAAVSIPAIEQNLDASILVSNLTVNWEVPSGYVSNNTAKRYFLKLGKIIQLNLKTELLLLSKPPITNKIAVEVEYNKDTKKFEVKGMTESSGEKSVDDVILKTVNNALDMNLRMNTGSFGNITGNPVLVIHL